MRLLNIILLTQINNNNKISEKRKDISDNENNIYIFK